MAEPPRARPRADRAVLGLVGRLARVLPDYAYNAWEGIVRSRLRRSGPARVAQGVVLDAGRVLLCVRSNLRGWELPGGNVEADEEIEVAVTREIFEETGLGVEVQSLVGAYHRTGFLPHTAFVYRCRPVSGALRTSRETPRVRWFSVDRLPNTIFPWFRGPLDDALAEHPEPLERHEHQGLRRILLGAGIDLRMRLSADRAGEMTDGARAEEARGTTGDRGGS